MAGHGGPDPGAVSRGKRTICEDEYAYDVALRLARRLTEEGAQVHIIIQDPNDGIRDDAYLKCDKDERSYEGNKIPLNQKKRLQQRTASVNHLFKVNKKKGIKDHRVISMHIDSRSKSQRQDVFFYYYAESKSGKNLALNLQETFKNKYDKYQKGRGYSGSVSARPLFVLRNTHPAAVFVELGNIVNKEDQKRFLIPDNRQALANWLYEGIIKD